MCGRYSVTTAPEAIARLFRVTGPLPNLPARYNAAPGQDLPVIRRHPETGEWRLDLLRWGLIPHWAKDRKIAWRCINARSENIARTTAFRDAYRKRRCLVPIDNFFEWKAIKGQKAKQPFAIGMRDRSPFGLAGVWENWRDPETDHWLRTFAIVTTDSNDLVAQIHDRMPAILAPRDFERWLGDEADPHDLLQPFPSEPMRMWPISIRVNKPENDDAGILDEVLAAG
jgi:putative SOS response-associated peptidase YedK